MYEVDENSLCLAALDRQWRQPIHQLRNQPYNAGIKMTTETKNAKLRFLTVLQWGVSTRGGVLLAHLTVGHLALAWSW